MTNIANKNADPGTFVLAYPINGCVEEADIVHLLGRNRERTKPLAEDELDFFLEGQALYMPHTQAERLAKEDGVTKWKVLPHGENDDSWAHFGFRDLETIPHVVLIASTPF